MDKINKIFEPLDEAMKPIKEYTENMKKIHEKFNH